MKLMLTGFQPLQRQALPNIEARAINLNTPMAVDTVSFSGKKKPQMKDMGKIVFDLMEKTLQGKVEWLDSGELDSPLDDTYGVSGVKTTLEDGRELHLGGDFKDYYAGEGFVMGIREAAKPGAKKQPKLQQYEVNEGPVAEMSEMISQILTLDGWRSRGSSDDVDEVATIQQELDKFRPQFYKA